MTRTLRSRLCSIPFALPALVPLACLAQTATFNLPAEPLSESLKSVGAQANINVMVSPALADGKTAPPLKGTLSVKDALTRLLAGTGLEYHFVNDQTVVIREEPAVATTVVDSPTGQPASSASQSDKQEVGKNSSHDFRMARVDQEEGSRAASVRPQDTAAPAHAEQGLPLQEIVVTATKRAERLSDIPLPVQAVTGEELQALGARSFDDYARTVAGLQFVATGAGRDQIFMRGIAAPQGYIGMQSAIGVYLDDVPVSEGLNQPDLNLYDIDRVEVLRGPQGTLYGSASMGGTIKLVTNKPDTRNFSAFVDGNLSGTHHGSINGEYNAVLNLPLVTDLAAVRGVFYGRNLSGYIDSPVLQRNHVNSENTYGGRISVRVTPRDDLTLDLAGMHQQTDQAAYNRVDSVGGDVDALTQYRHFNEDYRDTSTVLNGTGLYHAGPFDVVSSTSYNDRTRKEGDDLTGLNLFGDLSSTPSLQIYHTKSFTEEVRANSSKEGFFGWLLGAYYNRTRNSFYQTVDSADGITTLGLPTNNIAILQQSATTRELAGFGEASVRPFARFTITVGLRYDTVKLDADSARSGYLFGGLLADQANTSQHAVIPKLNLSYKLGPSSLVYTQASKGFRIGGLNVTFQPTDDGFVFPRSYKSDSLWNYEVGWKGLALDGVLSFDADVFLINWKNIQLDLQHEGYDYLTNAGNARSKGAELQATARLTRDWDLGGQLSYTDAHLTTTTPGVGNQGDRVPFVPKVSASVFLEYHTMIAVLGDSLARVDAQRVGTANTGFGSANNFVYGGYTLTNLRVGSSIKGTDVAIYAKNVFDVRARLFADPYQGGFTGVDPIAYTIARPRTVGVEVSHKFQ